MSTETVTPFVLETTDGTVYKAMVREFNGLDGIWPMHGLYDHFHDWAQVYHSGTATAKWQVDEDHIYRYIFNSEEDYLACRLKY